ncbi:hypothetical protein B0H13DRAFT_1875920 [Mycena leptocephala]|nr:hypothetical protein B0H13DRAFT_1875920 [Mycena leptocephala]
MYYMRGEERCREGKIERNGEAKCTQPRGEKRRRPPRGFKTRCQRRTLHLQPKNARLVVDTVNAPPPHTNCLQAGNPRRWREKPTWNMSDERRDGNRGDNRANPQHVLAKKTNGDKRKSRRNNRWKAQARPDDDEQQPGAPHNHAGGAWSYADIVCGWIEAVVMKEVKSRATENDGRRHGTSSARLRVEKRKLPEAGIHVSRKGETAKLPLLRPLAAGSEFQTRAQSPDGTPAQRVERVKEGWGNVRASTGKHGPATHDLRVRPAIQHRREMPAPQNLCASNIKPVQRTIKFDKRKQMRLSPAGLMPVAVVRRWYWVCRKDLAALKGTLKGGSIDSRQWCGVTG